MNCVDVGSDNMRFICMNKWRNGRKEQWYGEIIRINSYGSYIEMLISGRSSIRVICGRGQYGLWACIPDYQAGCALSYLSDTFYNTECLARAMRNKVDAITVAEALRLLADKSIF